MPNAALAKCGDNIAFSVFCTSRAFLGGFTVIAFPNEAGVSNEPDEQGVPKGDKGLGDLGLA